MKHLKKQIEELNLRLLLLEKELESIKSLPKEQENSSTYKEVIDEWLNGKPI